MPRGNDVPVYVAASFAIHDSRVWTVSNARQLHGSRVPGRGGIINGVASACERSIDFSRIVEVAMMGNHKQHPASTRDARPSRTAMKM